MSQKHIKIFAVTSFVLGLMFFTVAITSMPMRFTFDLDRLIGGMHTTFLAQSIGNILFMLAIIASTRVKKE